MRMREKKRGTIAFLGLLIAALLAACGATEEKRPATTGAPMGTATAAGMDTCATCHFSVVQDWLQTPHANLNLADPTNLSYEGSPKLTDLGTCTKTCHNPDLDDDPAPLATFFDSDHLIPNVTGPVGGRPVVGCEACHGLGSNHNGSGPIGPYVKTAGTLTTALSAAPWPTTTPTQIDVTATDTFTRPAGDFTADGFVAGLVITTSGFTDPANNGTFTIATVTPTTIVVTAASLVIETGDGNELIVSGFDVTAPSTFSRSAGDFTTDGFVAGLVMTSSGFTDAANNGTFIISRVTPTTIVVTAASLVTESGDGDELIVSNPVTAVSAQFNTCTDCHELTADGIHKASAAHRFGGTPPNTEPDTNNSNIITDTHFATAGDFSGAGNANLNTITGYAMNFSSETVCTDCHNPHKDIKIHREWAKSAHADFLSGAWAHYNWTCDITNCGAFGDRGSCQRCHTTTGYAAYANALETGNTALAEGIRTGTSPQVTFSATFKPEMLKCNGCHKDNKGTLRNPGAITANYDFISGANIFAKASHTYPDVSFSNVCMACHTGRESGKTIKNLNTGQAGTSTVDFGNRSFINSHYLTAGGTVFTATGYEFDGRTYENLAAYKHDKIGTAAAHGTGTRGPCIGCHMSRPNGNGDHLFLPVSHDAAGNITGIASEVCMECHGPSPTVILELVKAQKAQYTEALEALKAQLAVRGYNWTSGYPYFANTNWLTQSGPAPFPTPDTDPSGATSGKHNLGSAFNFNLFEHDPGGYVHNRIYVKRLIYDSIDWLDDNSMNYTVGATLNDPSGPHNGQPWQAEAVEYLLPNGVLTGIAAERP